MPVRRVFASLAISVAVAIGLASTVSAAGGYKIEFSNNCNNPAVCFDPNVAGSLGGDWGSISLDADGAGTAQFTTATHRTPGVATGAMHFSFVLAWSRISSLDTPPPGAFVIDPNGNYLVINVVKPSGVPPLVTPATPGHYKFQGAMFGMPGVNFMLQINAA